MTFKAQLRSIEPADNCFRVYELETMPAPDGGWVLITRRGRLGSPLRPREDHFPNEEMLVSEIARLLHLRTTHGYVLAR